MLKFGELSIRQDHQLIHDGETKYVDFFIYNKLKKSKYYWEHFGMTNNEKYKDEVAEKLY